MTRRHTERSYANLVSEHRKKYPQAPSRVLSTSPLEDLRFSSGNQKHNIESISIEPELQNIPLPHTSSEDLRMRRARRRAQDSECKKRLIKHVLCGENF